MKNWLKYTLMLLSLWMMALQLHPQVQVPGASFDRLALFTDRTMYIAGEKIRFTACMTAQELSFDGLPGRVLYCEIITPDGARLAGGKYPINGSLAQGCLQIPAEIASGTYYLRAYTKFMRNTGPSSYHYTRLMIINPDKKEVLAAREEDTAFAKPEKTPDTRPDQAFSIIPDKSVCSRREKITVNLSIPEHFRDSIRFACLTVAPEQALELFPAPVLSAGAVPDSSVFYPENRGISISGHLQDKSSGTRLPGIAVDLSILGEKDFMAMQTDTAGRFYFSLPDISGSRDLFLCSEQATDFEPIIRIDNDFCPLKVTLPAPPFNLTMEAQKAALEMAVNFKVADAYGIDIVPLETEEPRDKLPFYGQPTDVLVLDKYIELPTIEEYFNELSCPVKVRKSHDKKYFRFFSSQAEMVIYDPLILIDFVAVDDIDRILDMSPRDISRIELVNAPYIKGQMMYGGIVSFISAENDFAGIDLPSSGTFVSYGFFSACKASVPSGETGKHMPDARNTVFWEPNLLASGNMKQQISFITPDTPGAYLILIQGTDSQGNDFRSSVRIEIL